MNETRSDFREFRRTAYRAALRPGRTASWKIHQREIWGWEKYPVSAVWQLPASWPLRRTAGGLPDSWMNR